MAEYRVVPGSLSVTPTKSTYALAEPVVLHIICTCERRNGLGSWGSWSTEYEIRKKDDTVLKTVERQHSIAPWTELDQAIDDFEEDIGTFTQGILEGNVIVKAHG